MRIIFNKLKKLCSVQTVLFSYKKDEIWALSFPVKAHFLFWVKAHDLVLT